VLVVSPGPEPSRSLVTANLAAAYAEAGLRVHLVTSEDLRAEGAVAPAGLFHRPDYLTYDEVEAHSTPTQIPGVRRLGLAELLDGPGQLASFASDLVSICRQMADVVILDAPRLLTTFDAEALLPVVDTVLVVGETAMTTVDDAKQTGELLRRVKAPVIGVVLTNVAPKRGEARAGRAERAARRRRPLTTRAARSTTKKVRRSRPAREAATAPSESQPRRHLLPRNRRHSQPESPTPKRTFRRKGARD